MTVCRRATICGLLLCLWLPLMAGAAAAGDYPDHPIRLIIPAGVGTPPDIVGRILADAAAPRLGQPWVVENKPGTNGIAGLSDLAGKPADGYTLAMLTMPATVARAFYPKMSVRVLRDLAPVGLIGWTYNVLVVSAKSPVRSVADLVAQLKRRPGALAFASGGNGTPAHLAGALFTQMTGTTATHAPYAQLPQAVGDVIAGRVDFMFLTSVAAIAQVQGGTVRPLAVTGDRRLTPLPDVPTMIEAGYPDFDVRDWTGVVARSGTPAAVITQLNSALADMLRAATVRDRLAKIGVDPDSEDPSEFGKLIRSEAMRWRRVVAAAGIKPD